MKRLLIWIFVLQFATGHNMLEEVLRLPLLLEHFQLHRTDVPGLSFSTFLIDHYLNVRHQHAGDAHTNLPLHCSHSVFADSTLPQGLQLVTFPVLPESLLRNKLPVNTDLLPSGDYQSGLFRPPIA